MTLNAMRFYLEHYSHAHGGGPAPSIDPPNVANFPEYSSTEFSARVAIDQEALTQEPVPVATPDNYGINGAAGGDDGRALGIEGVTDGNHTNQAIGDTATPDDIDSYIIPVLFWRIPILTLIRSRTMRQLSISSISVTLFCALLQLYSSFLTVLPRIGPVLSLSFAKI
jgi:hypothetical protein